MNSKLSGFNLLMALAAAIVLMAAEACGDNEGRNGDAQEAGMERPTIPHAVLDSEGPNSATSV